MVSVYYLQSGSHTSVQQEGSHWPPFVPVSTKSTNESKQIKQDVKGELQKGFVYQMLQIILINKKFQHSYGGAYRI